MSNMYRSVLASGGGVQPTGDAVAADVLTGKTFSNASAVGVSGTMPNIGAVSGTATPSQPYTIPAGYHNGSGTVTATADEIYKGASRYITSNAYCVISIADSDPSNNAVMSSYTSSPTVTLGDITAKLTYLAEGSWTASIESTAPGKLYVNDSLVKTWTSQDLTAYTFNVNTSTANFTFKAVMD